MATLQFWRVGQTTPRTIAADARLLESSGWDGMTIADSQAVVGDSYVALAIAAQATSTLGIGTGVTNPVTRHPAVTASAIAGIQELSGGRALLGIGRGDSSLAHVGLSPAAPKLFEQYVRNVATYLSGGAVSFDDLDRTGHRPSQELPGAGHPEDSRLLWLSSGVPKVPVDVAASGPSVIRTAARHADRVTFGVGADPARLAWAIETARTDLSDAGRAGQPFGMGAYINVVAHPDERVARSMAATGVAMFSRFSVMHGKTTGPLSAAAERVLTKVSSSYDLRDHARGDAEHRAAVDDEHVTSFGIVGTPEQCVERLVQLSGLGLDRVMILGGMTGTSEDDQVELQRSREVLAAEVFPAVRERLARTS
jgi:5,10-methylenetetrahydromethanopterin reductase